MMFPPFPAHTLSNPSFEVVSFQELVYILPIPVFMCLIDTLTLPLSVAMQQTSPHTVAYKHSHFLFLLLLWADLAQRNGSSAPCGIGRAHSGCSVWALATASPLQVFLLASLFSGFLAAGQWAFRRERTDAASPVRGQACSLVEHDLHSILSF